MAFLHPVTTSQLFVFRFLNNTTLLFLLLEACYILCYEIHHTHSCGSGQPSIHCFHSVGFCSFYSKLILQSSTSFPPTISSHARVTNVITLADFIRACNRLQSSGANKLIARQRWFLHRNTMAERHQACPGSWH